MPLTVVLPGNLTGREQDRYFRCNKMSTMPAYTGAEDANEYLEKAIDHVDFVEIKKEEFNGS